MSIRNHFLVAMSCAALIVGCSESSLENDRDTPTPAVLVNAGADQTVDEETTVTLNAITSGLTGDLAFQWTASPSIAITQEDASVATATFVTPETTELKAYTFTVQVTDALNNKGSDTVIYQVAPVNTAPTAVIQVKQFSGLAVNRFPAGYQVVLDATASFDGDATDQSTPIAAYSWQQIAGEPVLGDISLQGDSLAFTTPILSDSNSIVIDLKVVDYEGAEDVNTVTLTVQSASDTLPTVDAGVSHQVFTGESINLNGTASTTVSASEPLKITWLDDSEKDSQIHNVNALQTAAIAPVVTTIETATFTLRVQDAQGNSVDDSVTVTIRPLPIQPLNDTGVILQATDSQVLRGYQGDYPGQDGQRGQDVIHDNGLSEKAGRGQQGFDFTRLDAIGDEVDDESAAWQCVRDNITGLIWESKTEELSTTLHSNSHSFTWYQSDVNGGFDGDETGDAASCSLTRCNTSSYVDAVNSQGLCNFKDWRLPTYNELLSIVHFGRAEAPMIDPEYFPHTGSSSGVPVWYWTQNASADGITNTLVQNAWALDFASGNDNFLNKSSAVRVRLVRAGR